MHKIALISAIIILFIPTLMYAQGVTLYGEDEASHVLLLVVNDGAIIADNMDEEIGAAAFANRDTPIFNVHIVHYTDHGSRLFSRRYRAALIQ